MPSRSTEKFITTDNHLDELGSELKTVRQVKRLSLNATYLQKLEAGIVKNPSPRVLNRIARVLDISYTRMMELAGYIMPAQQPKHEPGQTGIVKDALDLTDLSAAEFRAVAAFITYLRKQRGNTDSSSDP